MNSGADTLEIIRAGAADVDPLHAAFPDSSLPAKAAPERQDRFLVLVARRDQDVCGALGVDWEGKATAPDEPDIFHIEIKPSAPDPVWQALHDRAEELARQREDRSIGVAIEVMDNAEINRYEARGYKPRREGGPYRPLGPGLVEYLQGYTDPVGYLMDYTKPLV